MDDLNGDGALDLVVPDGPTGQVQVFYGDTPPNDPEELEETFLQRFPRCIEFDCEYARNPAEGETEDRLYEIHLSIALDPEGVMEAIATEEKRLLAFFEKRYQEWGEEVDEISFDYCF